jgi:hypothetical protein
MMEALPSSETSVLIRAIRCNIPEDGILHSHRRENLKSHMETSSFRVCSLVILNPERLEKSRKPAILNSMMCIVLLDAANISVRYRYCAMSDQNMCNLVSFILLFKRGINCNMLVCGGPVTLKATLLVQWEYSHVYI